MGCRQNQWLTARSGSFANIKAEITKTLRAIDTSDGAPSIAALLPVPEVISAIVAYAEPYCAVVTSPPIGKCPGGGGSGQDALMYPQSLREVLPPLPNAHGMEKQNRTESAEPEQWVVVIERLRHRILRYCLNDGRLIPFCGIYTKLEPNYNPPYSSSTAFASEFRYPAAVVLDPCAPDMFKGR